MGVMVGPHQINRRLPTVEVMLRSGGNVGPGPPSGSDRCSGVASCWLKIIPSWAKKSNTVNNLKKWNLNGDERQKIISL